jgi:prepilin-type N-terminal cleavage/methylation domain-containing protein
MKQKGLTLVEMLIAMAVGVLLLVGLATLFSQNKRSFHQNEDIARLQEDGRYALEELARDIGSAGFFAELVDPSAVEPVEASLLGAPDCGVPPAPPMPWIYTVSDGGLVSNAMAIIDNATAAQAVAAFPCITGADFVAGSDVVAVKRVAGAPSVALLGNRVYIRENGTRGIMYQNAAGIPVAIPIPNRDWEYTPRIYYIRNFAQTAGDGIPTLCRKVLVPGVPPTLGDECIAQGVEDLQVEFGIDTDNNGSANAYVTNPTLAQLQQVASARILVLGRSVRMDPSYTNPKTYQLSNEPAYTPNDNFYRRVFSSTIVVRNVNNMRRLGF